MGWDLSHESWRYYLGASLPVLPLRPYGAGGEDMRNSAPQGAGTGLPHQSLEELGRTGEGRN